MAHPILLFGAVSSGESASPSFIDFVFASPLTLGHSFCLLQDKMSASDSAASVPMATLDKEVGELSTELVDVEGLAPQEERRQHEGEVGPRCLEDDLVEEETGQPEEDDDYVPNNDDTDSNKQEEAEDEVFMAQAAAEQEEEGEVAYWQAKASKLVGKAEAKVAELQVQAEKDLRDAISQRDSTIIQTLTAALQAGDGVVASRQFYRIKKLSKHVGDWTTLVNQLLALSVTMKENLLRSTAAGDVLFGSLPKDDQYEANLNRIIVEEVVSPMLSSFMGDPTLKPEEGNPALALLQKFLVELKKKAEERRLGENSYLQKSFNAARYGVPMECHRRVVLYFNHLMDKKKLPSMKKFLGHDPKSSLKRDNAWYPFQGLPTMQRFMELDRSSEPLPNTHRDTGHGSTHSIRRDGSNIDGNEIVTILMGIEAHYQEMSRPFEVGSISYSVVEDVTEALMNKGKLKEIREEKEGVWSPDDDDDKALDTQGSKEIPAKYRKCQQAGDQNCGDYHPTEHPKHWAEHGMEADIDLLAQSYSATKLVRWLNELGIPLDLLLPSGRALRAALGLDECRSDDAVQMNVSLIFLITRHGDRMLALEKKKQQKKTDVKRRNNKKKRKTTRQKKSDKQQAGVESESMEPPMERADRWHVVAPAVAGFTNPYTDDFRRKLVEYQDRLDWIIDTSSKSQGRMMRCPFLSDFKPEQSVGSTEGGASACDTGGHQ